jgi:hypothetical protein
MQTMRGGKLNRRHFTQYLEMAIGVTEKKPRPRPYKRPTRHGEANGSYLSKLADFYRPSGRKAGR